MKKRNTEWLLLLLIFTLSCDGQKVSYKSPKGYDLTSPEKFNMPEVLHEISGIAFNKGNADSIYAEQDEEGKLFHFKLGDKKMIVSKFSKPGDFEDVTICNGYVVMLRSDGVLFSFPLSEANNTKANNVQEWKNLLPDGEFEGLCSIDSSSELFVLCKHCNDDKTSKRASGYIFKLDVKAIEALIGEDKINFHPSALTHNPFSNEWYILSAVNKLLVITDNHWKVKEAYSLKPALFQQPEGIAFDNKHNLYISNERNTRDYGTILKFAYQKK
jgi:hypothetical protein